MNFAMDFDFAGPSNLPYVQGPQPVPSAPHVAAVDPSYGQDCAHCLRTALGCGAQPTLEGLRRCQAARRATRSVLFNDCTLQARTFSPFPTAVAPECAEVCALQPALEYGAGYARPYANPGRLGANPWEP